MQLIPIRTAEVAEELDLIRGIACTHITLNIDYRTTPPTWTDYARKANRVERRAALLVTAVRDLERRKKDTMVLPIDWNLPDVEAALIGMKALLPGEVYAGHHGANSRAHLAADRADALQLLDAGESADGEEGR
jgi:hypothetical protein